MCNLHFVVRQKLSICILKLSLLSIVIPNRKTSWDVLMLFFSRSRFMLILYLFPTSLLFLIIWIQIYQNLVSINLHWTILKYSLSQTWEYAITSSKLFPQVLTVLSSAKLDLFEKWSRLDPKNSYGIPFQKLVFLISLYPDFLEKIQRNKKKLIFCQLLLFLFRLPS